MKITLKILGLGCLLGFSAPVLAQNEAPVVTVSQGKLIGEYSARNNRVQGYPVCRAAGWTGALGAAAARARLVG
jgi:hypothetical protein